MNNGNDGREDKKKKKKARKALLAYLKRLRKACKTFSTADQWYKFLKELKAMLVEYEQQIPEVHRKRINDAMRLIDSSRAGIAKACKVLQYEIEEAIGAITTGRSFGRIAVGGLVAAAVVVGAAVGYLNATAVDIVVHNNGCDTMQIPAGLPVAIAGAKLPQGPIPPGGHATARMPRVTVTVDATDRDAVGVTVLGLTTHISIGGSVASIELDGQPVLGQIVTFNLGDRKSHELVITCW